MILFVRSIKTILFNLFCGTKGNTMNLFFNVDDSKHTSGSAKHATMLTMAILLTAFSIKAHAVGVNVLQIAQYIK